MSESASRPFGRRGLLLGGAAVAGTLAMPAISYGQSDVVRIGHLTPRTGFLGPLGEYAVQAAQLAAEEINAAAGVLGRELRLHPVDGGRAPGLVPDTRIVGEMYVPLGTTDFEPVVQRRPAWTSPTATAPGSAHARRC